MDDLFMFLMLNNLFLFLIIMSAALVEVFEFVKKIKGSNKKAIRKMRQRF